MWISDLKINFDLACFDLACLITNTTTREWKITNADHRFDWFILSFWNSACICTAEPHIRWISKWADGLMLSNKKYISHDLLWLVSITGHWSWDLSWWRSGGSSLGPDKEELNVGELMIPGSTEGNREHGWHLSTHWCGLKKKKDMFKYFFWV